MSVHPPTVLFDLDRTLTRADTTLPWLLALIGKRRLALALAAAGVAIAWPGAEAMPTRVKRAVIRTAITGVPWSQAEAAGAQIAGRIAWRDEIVDALHCHLAQGDRVLIATGAPRPLAQGLLRQHLGRALPILATELAVEGGRCLGALMGENNTRKRKAARVSRWLAAHGQTAAAMGYGNAPDDLPMLGLCRRQRVIA